MIKIEVNKGQSELNMKGSVLELLADTAVMLKHVSLKISEMVSKEGYKMEPNDVIETIVDTMKAIEEDMEKEKAEAEKSKINKMKVIDINTLKKTKNTNTATTDTLDALMKAIFPND